MKKCRVCCKESSWKVYCSYNCYKKYWLEKGKKKYPIIKICAECGKEFEINDSFHNSQRYCSVQCQRVVEYRIRKEKYIYKPIKEKIFHKHICKDCWKEFLNKMTNSKYCNRKCFENNQKLTRIWKLNSSYRNWLYSKIWDEKEILMKRNITLWFWQKEYNRNVLLIKQSQIEKCWYYFCEHCKTSNAIRRETHHIIYRSEIPKNKNLHNIKNLLRLCIWCHNEFHKNKKLRNKYIQERWLNELFWLWFDR